jgi:transcriptional regulator GlxA family with amidase domain
MVRLRHTVEAMRRASGSLEGVAVEAGWASVNAFGRALRTVTGVKPSMLRKLPDEEYAALVHVQLTLPVPRPV